MSITRKKATKRKRSYISDPMEKIKQGKPWAFHFDIDPDVAAEIIKEKNGPKGGEYARIINARLRKGYGLPQLKAAS